MKVSLVGPFPESASDVKGGVASVILALARGLSARDCEVHVISTTGGTSRHSEGFGNFEIHTIQRTPLPGFLSYSTIVRSRIHKKLREIKPDITHFHGAAGYTLFYDQPHVLTIHGVNEKDALFDGKSLGYLRSKVITAQERFGRRRCENVIIISSYVLALLKRDIKGRTWTIENPVDDQFFYVDRIPQCTVLFSGVITPRKNVLGLLKAFALVLRCVPEARLRLAGPERVPDYAADCRRFVREGGISDRVDFLGPLSAEQMCSELSTAGCLALLSYQETAPVIIAEAMAAGVPVVASRVGGIPYIFDDGQSGYLTEPEDTDTAANRLCALLLDHSERDKMVIRGREAAHKRFRTSSVVAKTLYCYRQVLG